MNVPTFFLESFPPHIFWKIETCWITITVVKKKKRIKKKESLGQKIKEKAFWQVPTSSNCLIRDEICYQWLGRHLFLQYFATDNNLYRENKRIYSASWMLRLRARAIHRKNHWIAWSVFLILSPWIVIYLLWIVLFTLWTTGTWELNLT